MRTVPLPSHPFTARSRERAFLTHRPNARRLPMPAVYVARRAAGQAHHVPRVALDFTESASAQHGWTLASLALMALVVVLAFAVSGIRL